MANLLNSQEKIDLICFSHLRWNFIFQRPQHLMTRFAKYMRVYYVEEYVIDTIEIPFLQVNNVAENIWIVTPHLSENLIKDEMVIITGLIDRLIEENSITKFYTWYYTPMSLNYSRHLEPEKMIFDCMDELSAFKFSPPELKQREHELLNVCDLVFTGGDSLFQTKKNQHDKVILFPSSIDYHHFSTARSRLADPIDQQDIPFPRMGFFGTIDERLDILLLEAIALKRPDWNIIMVGPVVKIDPGSLPKMHNIHYLGMRTYNQLPAYISNWDVA